MKHMIIFTDEDLMKINAGLEVECKVDGEPIAFMSEHRYKRIYEKEYGNDKKGEEK